MTITSDKQPEAADPQAVSQIVDQGLFRHVVGHFASGISVITTRDADDEYGATVSAVSSVSLDPPMLLTCINRRNSTQGGIHRSGVFAVNILAEEHGELAYKFATPGPGKFEGIRTLEGVTGVPLLADALAHIECRVVNEVESGTHSVFIAEVISAVAHEGRPLSYFCGQFGRIQRIDDEAVYATLRTRILGRDLPVGDLLRIDDLAAELGTSPATILDSLAKMSAEGLVARDPEQGYRVRPIDAKTIGDAFDARCAIELGVIDLVVGNVADEELAELRHRAEATLPWIRDNRHIDFERYRETDRAFHECLVSLAHNETLLASYRRLNLEALIARARGDKRETTNAATEEHMRIVEAFEAGNVEQVRQLVRGHEEHVKEMMLRVFSRAGGVY